MGRLSSLLPGEGEGWREEKERLAAAAWRLGERRGREGSFAVGEVEALGWRERAGWGPGWDLLGPALAALLCLPVGCPS